MSENGEGFQPQPVNIETIKAEPKTENKRETLDKAHQFVVQVGIEVGKIKQIDQKFNNNVDQNLNRFKDDYSTTASQPGSQELKHKVEPIIRDINQKISFIKSIANNFGSDQFSVSNQLENIFQQISSIEDLDEIQSLVNKANQIFKSNVDSLSNDRDQSKIIKNQLNNTGYENEMNVRQVINNKQYDPSFRTDSRLQALFGRCQSSSRFLVSQIDAGVQTSNQTDFLFKNNIHEQQKQFADTLQTLVKPKLTN